MKFGRKPDVMNLLVKNGPIIFIFYLKSGRFLSEDIELDI